MLYSHHSLPLTESSTFDDGFCQVLLCQFDTIKTVIAVVYRPPNAPASSFSDGISFLSKSIATLQSDYQIHVCGDFNLPSIDWGTEMVLAGTTLDQRSSADKLLSFMSDHLMRQYVTCPTRKSNTLDLFFTTNPFLVTQVSSVESNLSDHNLVDITLSINPTEKSSHSPPSFNEDSFRSIDFTRADFDLIRTKIKAVNWTSIRQTCSFEEFPEVFTKTLLEICLSCAPKKKPGNGRPRAINALRRKKKRLRARINALKSLANPNPNHIRGLQQQLALIAYDIKESINAQLDYREQKAIQNIKANPKTFFSYAKSHSAVKSSIAMLLRQTEGVTTDPAEMADILQDQFTSVFSDPESPNVKSPEFPSPPISKPLSDEDFVVTTEDILSAIKDLKSDSAAGPDGVPVILIKECAQELCQPLIELWSESFELSTVPLFYKASNIAALYKKGDRVKASNYRPVSLTSHVIKVYERTVRRILVQYLESNDILCPNQHGFRTGRSCLTQLLSHFDDILQGLQNGHDTDSIYLDYAKAFDKVDHKLLLQKLKIYGLPPKLTAWIASFLEDRPQTVVVNGIKSYVAKVLSGVPQGTVLGPILFILFINDMGLCVKHSIMRFFADDTRISKQTQLSFKKTSIV